MKKSVVSFVVLVLFGFFASSAMAASACDKAISKANRAHDKAAKDLVAAQVAYKVDVARLEKDPALKALREKTGTMPTEPVLSSTAVVDSETSTACAAQVAVTQKKVVDRLAVLTADAKPACEGRTSAAPKEFARACEVLGVEPKTPAEKK